MKSLSSILSAALVLVGVATPLPAQTKDDGHGSPSELRHQQWRASQDALYEGPAVTTRDDLKPYTGRAAADRIIGNDRRLAYLLNYKQLGINYGEAADFHLRREQVILCPQTVDFLYSGFTPTEVKLKPGSHPVLEKVVDRATSQCKTQQEKALAVMRFCRDLYKQHPHAGFSEKDPGFANYVYGGTEEQLIDKPEILCECLGRLMVALCELAGMPGRIVMHDIGGHICSEIQIDGHWAYIDPRCGMYFLKLDGKIASVLELCQNPSIIRAQPDHVKADVSELRTWQQRAWKCENVYFHRKEVNGFENYSLSEKENYSYTQLPREKALAAGLMDVNKEYVAAIRRVFGLAEDGTRHTRGTQKHRELPVADRRDQTKLQELPVYYRTDGFSLYYKAAYPLTKERLEREQIDPLCDGGVSGILWGICAGSRVTFGSERGQLVGEGLTDSQWGRMRAGDRNAYRNLKYLIDSGHNPLQIAAARAHTKDTKLLAYFHLNKEYGPIGSWTWELLTDDFSKQHAKLCIRDSLLLDFSHAAVRERKLAILRDAARQSVDGIALNMMTNFFTDPEAGRPVLTEFIRSVRKMLDDVGRDQGRRLELWVRVPFQGAEKRGIDWKAYMREDIIDAISAYKGWPAGDYFDVPMDPFIEYKRQIDSSCRVHGFIWQALGLVDTDPTPKGKRRFDKPKVPAMYHAQALIHHRVGSDGIELGFASPDQWKPFYGQLGNPQRIEFADKRYMVDIKPHLPLVFGQQTRDQGGPSDRRVVPLRVADEIRAAHDAGFSAVAHVVLYCRPLEVPDERIEITINDHGPIVVDSSSHGKGSKAPVAKNELRKQRARNARTERSSSFLNSPDWWKRGQTDVSFPAAWLVTGRNELTFHYVPSPSSKSILEVPWIEITIEYKPLVGE